MHLPFLAEVKKSEPFHHSAQSLSLAYLVHGYILHIKSQKLTFKKWKLVKNRQAKNNNSKKKKKHAEKNKPSCDR